MYDPVFGWRTPYWRCVTPGCGALIRYSPLDHQWFHCEPSSLPLQYSGGPGEGSLAGHVYGQPPPGVTPATPVCLDICDDDCPEGAEHCEWIHQPCRKPGGHGPEDCPLNWAERQRKEAVA